MTLPDFGEPGRYHLDPAARDIIRRIHRDGFIQATTLGQIGNDGENVERRFDGPEYLLNGLDPDESVGLADTGTRFHRMTEGLDLYGYPYAKTACGVHLAQVMLARIAEEQHYGPCQQCWNRHEFVPRYRGR
jgi:hypothetical protein